MSPKIGFVGLGTMGSPMVRTLLSKRIDVVGYDSRPEAIAALSAPGFTAADSIAGTAIDTEAVITMLPGSRAVESVVLGNGGLLETLQPDQVLIDMSSSEPASTRSLSQRLAEKGADMLDAPVSGGVVGATTGTLSIMCGGPRTLFERWRGLLRALGTHIFYVGESGAGHTINALNNLVYAASMAAVAEALVAGFKAGLSPETMVEVISASSGSCHAISTKAPRQCLAGDFRPGFPTKLLAKELDIARSLLEQMGVPAPVSAAAVDIFDRLETEGYGPADSSSVVASLEKRVGVRVRMTNAGADQYPEGFVISG